MFKKYDITIEKKEAGIPYRRNLQIWSESIEKVLKIMGIKLHKDPKYFGYNIVDIKSAEDSFYNINYDTIISSQEKENDVVSELYDFMIWGDYDAKIQTLANMTDENWNFHGKTNNLKEILCALNSIDVDSVDFSGKCNDLSSISFTINRYTENYFGNLIEANGYELVSKYMRLYVTNVGWFIMDTPEIHSTGNIEYKTINASSAEIEFKQIPLDTWKVNKGTTDSLL